MTILIPAWVKALDAGRKAGGPSARPAPQGRVGLCSAGNKVLIQRRAMGKYHTPGLWANTCCTHPEWDEAPLDCAQRRLQEELGITGLDPEYRDHVEYRADVGDGLIEHEVVDLFIAVAPEDLAIDPNPEEVMETQWMAYDVLCETVKHSPERFTPWLKIYLEEHGDRIFGAIA